MIGILELTEEFEIIDSETQLDDVKYKLLIEHDFVKKTIDQMFSIYFLDENNIKSDSFIMNGWKISSFGIENYFGRAKLYASVFDPNNKFAGHYENGAYTLTNNEENNIRLIKYKIIAILKNIKKCSYFKDSISRLDYVNAFKKENKGKYEEWQLSY